MTPRPLTTDHIASSPRILASTSQVNEIQMAPKGQMVREKASGRQNILVSRRRRAARRGAY